MPTKQSPFNFDLKANHLVREQFISFSIIYPVFIGVYAEVEYGYMYYHHAGLALGYRFSPKSYTPYVVMGMFYNRDHFSKNGTYREYTTKIGIGLETDLPYHFFVNVEADFLKYLSIDYALRKINYREQYDFSEAFDYSVVIGIGYRFRF